MSEKSEKQKIDDLLTRGVGEFIDPDGIFRKKLETNPEKIVIKLGADPTRPDLHLGHAVILHKLRLFQDLGCKIVFIVGDFTTLFGDPTGKSKIRPKFSLHEEIDNTANEFKKSEHQTSNEHVEYVPTEIPSSIEIAKNMETYIEQVKRILLTDEAHFSWIKNSDWFLGPTDLNFNKESNPALKIDFLKKGELEPTSLSVNFDVNTLMGKSILYEKTRMQTQVKKDELTLITSRGLLWTLQYITHSRLIERDMFKERIKNKEELYMHEMLYPVLQGIDSFALSKIYGSCDLEVGGTDQTFNMLMGRDVLKANKLEPQAVLTFKLLEGTDGKEKMSKSLDNYIGITDEPNDMYGKVMSIPDYALPNYFELCTDKQLSEIKKMRNNFTEKSFFTRLLEQTGVNKNNSPFNPKDLKMELARKIVFTYYGEEKAAEAEEAFINTFQKKKIPEVMTQVKFGTDKESLMDLLAQNNLVSSKGDFRRLVEEGAVTNLDTDEKIDDANFIPKAGQKFRIGKKRFVKII